MPNWTKEFIAGQREIKPASVLPIVGKWDEVPAFEGALHYCAIFGFHKAETWSTGSDLAMQDIKYLENAANNYPSALDEIERAHTENGRLNWMLNVIVRGMKSDIERHSYAVAAVNVVRLLELNGYWPDEGGEG